MYVFPMTWHLSLADLWQLFNFLRRGSILNIQYGRDRHRNNFSSVSISSKTSQIVHAYLTSTVPNEMRMLYKFMDELTIPT
jgi:hypothetical protein